MALSGNKGEWSEIYALLRLLADGLLYEGDERGQVLREFFILLSGLCAKKSTLK